MILNTESFELRILKKKRRIGVEQFKKGIKRKLYFAVPAQEAKSGQPLAPILGQVQINTFDFVSQFNTKSKDFPKGTLLYVELIVMWDKTFFLNFKPFPLQCLIHDFLFSTPNILNSKEKQSLLIFIGDVYKIVLIYQKITGVHNLNLCLDTVLGCLNSFNIKVSLFSEQEQLDMLQYFLENNWMYFFLIEKNIRGFGIYNKHFLDMYELLENNLILLEDRQMVLQETEEDTLAKANLNLDSDNDLELLEY